MRLLDTSTLKLHEFYDDKIPWYEYAILSHTWGEEEVSFHDLQNKPPEQLDGLEGYVKIKACCVIAKYDRYKYVWIDTCCIDKTSSAELSEAINSMYRWYRDAGICYAYLVDVWIGHRYTDSRTVVQEFRESRWFTRGWTLQELLAPKKIWFFDKDWQHLGNKVSSREELSRITGIQEAHMFEHTSASAAQKMSWASRRRTTRLEDMAYSLLGIFDVNMPLLYGEGSNAFTRLQHEIVKISDDESTFAWEDNLLQESGIFALSPEAFAKSGDIIQINDLHPLYVTRAPYAVTNRGLAIETFAHEKGKPARVSDLDISLLPLNCGRQAKPGTKQVEERVVIELTNTSRDGFVRWSPRLLKPPRCSFNLTCPRLVYIRLIYTLSKKNSWTPPLYINAESLNQRRFLLAETFSCQSEREGFPRFKQIIRVSRPVNLPAISFKSSEFGCPALFGVILHTAGGVFVDGIDLIVSSTAQTFLEEMNKYSSNCQATVETRAFKTLQDGSQVSVVLKRKRVDSKHYSWIYSLEIS